MASAGTRERLEEWIAALAPHCLPLGIELVVARASAREELRDLQTAHPQVLFMPGPDGCTLRQLRGYGLAAADGDIVVLIDDSQPPDAARIEALTAGARAPA